MEQALQSFDEPSVLGTPQALALLAESEVDVDDVRGCSRRLGRFLGRYLPLFPRREHRDNARIVIEGLLGGLERKTAEPIARAHGVQRKPIQAFVGCGAWDDEAVMAEVRRHTAQEMSNPHGVLILDPSAFAKKGTESCGVKRQWCGRLGKVENCQLGVFLAYATDQGQAPLDRRLYLPREWAEDEDRRKKCHVPESVKFRTSWEIGLEMVQTHGGSIAHGWVVADDELGRVNAFRKGLRDGGERYVVDVPSDTHVRDLLAKPPAKAGGVGGSARKAPFLRVDAWANAQPPSAWRTISVRDGEKGPISVEAVETDVQTRGAGGRVGEAAERLVVIRRQEQGQVHTSYHLSNAAAADAPLDDVVRARGRRQQIEQLFAHGKGETGLGDYEVRSWVGWHHHMTLSLLALWFLNLERRTIGGKNLGRNGATGAPDRHAAAAAAPPNGPRHRDGDQRRAATHRGIANLSLATNHRRLSAEPSARDLVNRLQ
jgi:SRSO17 transposase